MGVSVNSGEEMGSIRLAHYNIDYIHDIHQEVKRPPNAPHRRNLLLWWGDVAWVDMAATAAPFLDVLSLLVAVALVMWRTSNS